ncbi:MAG: D-alanyl-D-alanine carboxypeptidase [Syntrophomonadaceae bacterium]|nr:D-alanyl-D-alanine carboxypeptidase [Syntrophomonadaceae bacterium]
MVYIKEAMPYLLPGMAVSMLLLAIWRRKNYGPGNIKVLTILILISVFIVGFTKTNHEVQFYINTAKNNPVVSGQTVNTFDAEVASDIIAKNVYLYNVDQHTVLYEKESDQRIAPASTAKMLTALTVLECCDDDEEVLIGQEIKLIAKDSSTAGLHTGNILTVHQLLDALLLPSGNDAAYALAVFAGRKMYGDDNISIDEALKIFIRAMNEKAADIGAADSNFINPDGYDAAGQYTTAHDLACIAEEFWNSSILRDISGSYCISDVWLSNHEVTYYNTNELINPASPFYYKNAAGIKTGTSGNAGYCLVSAAYINDKLYLCVVMGSSEKGRFIDSLTLYHAIDQ